MESLRRTLPNANALIVFEAAARLSSFTRAAEELGISQPAVTRHIRTLEEILGKPLFQRSHNRLALTSDGAQLWTAVSTGLEGIADTVRAIREGARRRRIVFATHSGMAQQWLMPRLAALTDRLPGIDLQLTIVEYNSDWARSEHDIAIRIAAPDAVGPRRLKLVPETVFPVAAPDFLVANPQYRDAPAAALGDGPLLHMDDGDRPWMGWREWFRAQGIRLDPHRPRMLYSNYPLILQEVLAGRGIALAWRPLTDHLVAQGALVPLGPETVSRQTGYYFCWSPGAESAGLSVEVGSWLREEFGPLPEEPFA
jgi:DNA-binding transcriptional LysR family regulator